MYNEALGKIHFFLMFIGVNVIFFPMHFLGLDSMPRRVPDYTPAYAHWNNVSTYGYMITVAGVAAFFLNLLITLTAGKKAPDNPWGEGATTLEWTFRARRRSTSSDFAADRLIRRSLKDRRYQKGPLGFLSQRPFSLIRLRGCLIGRPRNWAIGPANF